MSGKRRLSGKALLNVRDLAAGYGGRPVLRGISLKARGGESVALLGPNGSGKTTLLRCVSGVLRPLSGGVWLAGRAVERLRPRERARLAAVVPQRAECPPGLSARRMVLLGRYPYLSWLGGYGRRDYEAAERALAATGAAGLAGRRVDELSGGELQRVLLARALAQESPLLLLDELAAGLDLARMVELFDLLERRRAAGACLFMVMHDCNLASLYATRLIGLKNGRVLFDGPASAIFTEENLSALYDTPIRVFPHPRWGLPQALPDRASGPWSGLASAPASGSGPAGGGAG
ncbi:ABC transporter ATP-binding protein [Desulfovibrio sp. SGI.169]|uniref:ABC transporter ATP-binding protein n=1 Tax=Desulfovibrio sp. SGI.169 TaxID=3420561 RepID=UPI003D0910D0